MPDPDPSEPDAQLIVFADDWGRHPSSAQHLVKELLPAFPTLWVNTVGTRTPGLNRADLRRGLRKVGSMLSRTGVIDDGPKDLPAGLQVIQPVMYPGFRTGWQRRFNRHQVSRTVREQLGETFTTAPLPGSAKTTRPRRVVVTTLPITADLVGTLGADRWVYYCVDDFSQWPGTDHAVMDAMERELVAKVDAVVCVSEALRERVASMGRGDSTLLTHGVEIQDWQLSNEDKTQAIFHTLKGFMALDGSPVTFWGLIDQRLDKTWIERLSHTLNELKDQALKICLVGPVVGDKREWECLRHSLHGFGEVFCCGEAKHSQLPTVAYYSPVLVMPYIDAPVTRAMQPLKLKEYLATMKPVVVRDLPATREWADCCDLATSAEQFAELVTERARTGTPNSQLEARKRRLPGESWAAKAAQLAAVVRGS